MHIKFSATPKPERRNDKNKVLITDNVPLLIDVAFNGNRFYLTSGYRINANLWGAEEFDKYKHPQGTIGKRLQQVQTGKAINLGVASLLGKIDKTFKRFGFNEVMPTVAEFKQALNPKTNKKEETTESESTEKNVFESFDLFIEQGRKEWQSGTVKKQVTTKSHLFEFDSNVTFEELNNTDTIEAFIDFLNTNKGLRTNSAEKYWKNLKWFLRWATIRKHTQFSDFLNYRPKFKAMPKEVIFLTQDEFTHLYNLKIELPHLERVRDVFCFSCVTGLRWSDIENLKKSQIKDGIIHVTTIKTNQKLTIQLNNYSKAILDKYADHNFENGKALHVPSNQKCNEYLKNIGQLAGFNEQIQISYKVGNDRKDETYPKHALLSFHCGRRTFVCLGLWLGLSAKVIMSYTGHLKAESMKPYEKIIEELKSKEMTKFNF